MKVLVTGGTSLLGKYLTETKPSNIQIESTWHTNFLRFHTGLDITNRTQVHNLFNGLKPHVVIHCAAIGDVELAETDYQMVREVNVIGTQNVIRAAKRYDTKVILISSNAVFSGSAPPYDEYDACDPINAYGKIKREAERLLIDRQDLDWLIIRPFMLYGWPYNGGRSNWGATIINKLRASEPIKLVNDKIWMPTYTGDVARAIWRLIEIGGDKEIYHVASLEKATLYTFGLKIAKVYGLDAGLIEEVPSSHFEGIAARPKDSTYNLNRIIRLEIEMSGIEMGINKMRDEQLVFNDAKARMGW